MPVVVGDGGGGFVSFRSIEQKIKKKNERKKGTNEAKRRMEKSALH